MLLSLHEGWELQQLGQMWLPKRAHPEHQPHTLTPYMVAGLAFQDPHIGKVSLIVDLYVAGT